MYDLQSSPLEFLTREPIRVWGSLIVLLGLAYLLYRHTNPPVSRGIRILLAGLRAIAIVTLVACLLQPVIRYLQESERLPRAAVLIDYSASMDIVDDQRSRAAIRDSLLSSEAFEALQNRTDLTTYYFGAELSRESDQLDRQSTALGEALSQLQQAELGNPSDFWLLLTDGNSNAGRSAVDLVSEGSIPLYAADLASGARKFDIGLDEVAFDPVCFVGQPTTLTPQLQWHGASGQTVSVELLESGSVVASQRIPLSVEDGKGQVELRYTPTQAGQKMLQVRVAPQESEKSSENNSRSLAVKVLRSRMSILLVSERPDYEVGFLKRTLERSDQYDVELRVTGQPGGNLSGVFPNRVTTLNQYDLIILHDPPPSLVAPRADELRSYLADRGGAIWLIMGEQFVSQPPSNWMAEVLPFRPGGQVGALDINFNATPEEEQLFHPAVRLADDHASIRQLWAELPPFARLIQCTEINSSSVILATAPDPTTRHQSVPALGYRRVGPGKVLASAVTPFWPWGFTSVDFATDDQPYEAFVSGTIEWLTVADDFAPVQIKPESEVVTRGQSMKFTAFAYDLGYRALPGVEGTIDVTNKNTGEEFHADLIDHGNGNLSAEFANLPPGDYSFDGKLEKDGSVLKQVAGEVRVETFSLEEYDRFGQPTLLADLARRSGGEYARATEFDNLLNSMELSTIQESRDIELFLWGEWWLLFVLVGALSLEWLLRKIHQLI